MNHGELKEIFRKLKRSSPKIQRVSQKFLEQVIEHRTPCGLFLTREGRMWVAVDNSSFDAWTENFDNKRQAVRWLRGKFEVCV